MAGFRVKHNVNKIMARIDKATQAGIKEVTTQFVKDSNRYVRYLTGDTERSSYRDSDYAKGKARWTTSYVREIYYTGYPRREENPNASLEWAHKNHAENKNKYLSIMNKHKG